MSLPSGKPATPPVLLFAPLALLLTRAQLAYDRYQAKRTFLNAQLLRRINRRIVRLLHDQAVHLPPALVRDAAELLNHYEGWMIEFDRHRRTSRPSLDTMFVFTSGDPSGRFPKEAVSRLLAQAAH